ncbi:extracellular solute-binding protein [Paenibacillus sp. HWE-109]|uniref:extracellular solute-binding protein n=1 Tax=Paenibacillus sp. HWE-109 TaxID=1306526 RepID=UPI001EDC9823|nr:extracellular solute-binding protein [Paenibacillus sp. HWE-109]UKS26876.1 extracellular solute-binding protein [Paenibacillus sp. HWE-109]
MKLWKEEGIYGMKRKSGYGMVGGVMSIALFLSMLTACSGANNAQDSAKGTNQPSQGGSAATVNPKDTLVSDKKITLKAIGQKDAQGAAWGDLRIFKDLETLTNVHYEFDAVSDGYLEKKNLALATGNLPDVIFGPLGFEDEETYGPQGVLIDLTDLIEKYAPNIKKALNDYPLLKKTMTASDGKIYSLGQVASTPTMGAFKPVINKSWLTNLNLKMPETTSDLYEVLKAFRDNDPMKDGKKSQIPMGEYQFFWLNGMLLPAFGESAADIALKDRKVVFTPSTDGYKHYLQYLNKLYTEKLIDPMFISQSNDEYLAKTKKNIYGVLGQVRLADWKQYEMMSPLTSEYSKEKVSSSSSIQYSSGKFAITKANKYPIETIKWADLFFADLDKGVEGITGASLWLGKRGVDWDFSEGNKSVKYLFQNDAGLNEVQMLLKKFTPSTTGIFGKLVLKSPFEADYSKWLGENNMTKIFPYIKPDKEFPAGARFKPDEASKITTMMTDISKYVEESRAKFVTGDQSFEKWDVYIKNLESMKVKEYVKLYQDAYDRFQK